MADRPKLDVLRTRHGAVRAIVSRQGGVTACRRASIRIDHLIGLVESELRAGTLPIPGSAEETARLLSTWLEHARRVVAQTAIEDAEEVRGLEAVIETLDKMTGTGARVIPFPTPKPKRPRVRRRKKNAPG